MLATSDMINYQPGSYTIKITGTSGELSASELFTITLADPCGEESMNSLSSSEL